MMKTLQTIETPTGHILIVKGDCGKLELLSLGDYGKEVNIKCDALGLNRVPERVRHTDLLPLTEKWVITVSTQYGCSMGCKFCDVPRVGPGLDATTDDLINQVKTGIALHPEIEKTNRLNIHFARMGEPTWNPNVLDAARWFKHNLDPSFMVHPVVSTMMPKRNPWLKTFIRDWMLVKNSIYQGNAGLQLSINSTDEAERFFMFSGNAHTLEDISDIMRGTVPQGRKITLNFAVANYTVDPTVLLKYFDPREYIIKLTPMHQTAAALSFDIKTRGDYTAYYPYEHHEVALRNAGYDVLVFIASEEEDASRITCGNAILADKE